MGNIQFVDYFPYNQVLQNYTAAIVHGGTGLVYSCLRAGVPMLVAPQDFDQFDHAARIAHRNLGRSFSLREPPSKIAMKLQQLLTDEDMRQSVLSMRQSLLKWNPYDIVASRLQRLTSVQ